MSEPTSAEETASPEVPVNLFPSLEGKTPEEVGNVFVIRDLAYGDRVDLTDISSRASSQIFDVYLPAIPSEMPANAPVLLYIHGGGWSDPNCNKDTEALDLLRGLAEDGMIVFTMNYVLAGAVPDGGSAEDMLSDIGLMLSHAEVLLEELGVQTDGIGIGGTSAGAHLAMLYAYRCGQDTPFRIAYAVDIAGPVDMLCYKAMIPPLAALFFSPETILRMIGSAASAYTALLGLTEEDIAQLKSVDDLWEVLKAFSPLEYVNADSCPTILMYGRKEHGTGDVIPASLPSDGLVPVACCDSLAEKLRQNGVPYTAEVFPGYSHTDFPWKAPLTDWARQQILQYAEQYR